MLYYQTFGLPIWVSEFACQVCSVNLNFNDLLQLTPLSACRTLLVVFSVQNLKFGTSWPKLRPGWTSNHTFMRILRSVCDDDPACCSTAQNPLLRFFSVGLLLDMHGVNPLNQLMKNDGSPTDLGYFYINAWRILPKSTRDIYRAACFALYFEEALQPLQMDFEGIYHISRNIFKRPSRLFLLGEYPISTGHPPRFIRSWIYHCYSCFVFTHHVFESVCIIIYCKNCKMFPLQVYRWGETAATLP